MPPAPPEPRTPPTSNAVRVAIDTGGTFTDAVAHDPEGRPLARVKVPSTPHDPSEAIAQAVAALGLAPEDLAELRHGTTVGTNALLERRGARVVLITNAGFEDLLRLARQSRPDLYALHPVVPPPLVPPERCLGIAGRLDAEGREIEPLEDPRAFVARHQAVLSACEAVAVCLLHAYASDRHETALGAALREALPDTPVTLSSALVPLPREYERAVTCTVNAYLAPILGRYLDALGARMRPAPVSVMTSGGGLVPKDRVASEPVHTVLSGPAGGVRGVWEVGRRCGRTRLLGLDMGGTSADVCTVTGALWPEDEGRLGEHPLRVPLLPIETIGAGGGSIAWVDAGGALRVGPRSAGADPGPAAYGRFAQGAEPEPTVTDAHVVLGRVTALLGGAMPLDAEAARAAVARLAARLGTGVEETAAAILRVCEATMARACKRVTLERGVDPRTLTLVAFGGAGGLHGCALAEELGCPEVLFPREPGVLSAEGILTAPAWSAATRALTGSDADTLTAALEGCVADAAAQLARDHGGLRPARTTVLVDCRYRGQSFTLPLDAQADLRWPGLPPEELPAALRRAFDARHRERYGYALDGAAGKRAHPVELDPVAVRAFAYGDQGDPAPSAQQPPTRWEGPAAVGAYSATLWLPAGWSAERLPSGDILCRPSTPEAGSRGGPTPDVPALALLVHRHRLTSIAEEMGAALMRAGFSANIKERRDFSCALFDGAGRMLVQAAHIPVHLGSQQLGVEAAIGAVSMGPGDQVILNDPFAGGTHLPDITVVAPVFLPDAPRAAGPASYVANRAHHADIGGISAGSMPAPDEGAAPLTIDDEGWRSPPVLLTEAIREDLAHASRAPAERRGDLRAQEAANHVGKVRLLELAAPGNAALDAALLDYAERRMRAVLASLPDGTYAYEDVLDDDGAGGPPVRIPVVLTIEGDRARVDLRGAAPQVPGSLNAVRAITVSAVFYVFRCLGGDTLPANAGLLRPIEILTTPGTICDAVPPAAVSAGNVETSQRLVDVLLGALAQAVPDRVPAASCGSMNNVLFGGVGPRGPFVHYETLAGGAGASAAGDGASAVHTHMTNTLNTPVEELERAFPVRIVRYAVRAGSGGPGRHRGGDGVVRAYRFEAPAEVSLIGERRAVAPPGLGGGPASPGRHLWIPAGGAEVSLPGKARVQVGPGDVIVVETPGGGGWDMRTPAPEGT